MTPTVRVLYVRNHHWSTPVLRAAMWSPWSHCAIVLADGQTVIDATFKNGVKARALAPIIAGASLHDFRDIDCPDPQAAYDFLFAQIGKPYDTWGVAGVGLHRDWQAEDAWFCSELVEAALAAGGNQRFVNHPRRVTPQHSWMVA